MMMLQCVANFLCMSTCVCAWMYCIFAAIFHQAKVFSWIWCGLCFYK